MIDIVYTPGYLMIYKAGKLLTHTVKLKTHPDYIMYIQGMLKAFDIAGQKWKVNYVSEKIDGYIKLGDLYEIDTLEKLHERNRS